MSRKSSFFILVFISTLLSGQQITLNENFEDWDQLAPVHSDHLNDGPFLGIDFGKLWMDNDDKYLYLSFETNSKINLQDPNEFSIYIDLDNDPSTGISMDNIGADLRYNFGDRDGMLFLSNGNSFFIDHFDIGFVSLPTVSSDRFEIKFNRNLNAGGQQISIGDEIKVVLKDHVSNGDRLPSGLDGISYALKNKTQNLPTYNLGKQNSAQLRILSYNVERDNYFKSGGKPAIQRILTATQPDIIAFQEIYDNSSQATADQVSEVLSATNGWFHAKAEPDIILVSRYPIIEANRIDGNGAFLIDKDGQEIFLINLHLPCCDNNSGRTAEVSNIVSYIDDSKAGNTAIDLKPGTPIIILGDTNFVGQSEQVSLAQNGFNGDLDWGQPLIDAKPLTTGEPQTFTWYNPFSDYCPGRLDYIFYSKSLLTKKNNFVLFTESMTDAELSANGLNTNDTSNASDHLPVICDFTLSPSVSTEENDLSKKIVIYPNPARNLFSINGLADKSSNLQIVDSAGLLKSTHPISSSSNTINTESLSNGMYLLRLQFAEQSVTKRLIICR